MNHETDRTLVLVGRLKEHARERGWHVLDVLQGSAHRLVVTTGADEARVTVTSDGSMHVFGPPSPLVAELLVWKATHASFDPSRAAAATRLERRE